MNDNRDTKYIAGGIAAVFAAVFFFAFYKIEGLNQMIMRIGSENLVIFALTVILFCLMFMGVYQILQMKKWKGLSGKVSGIFGVLLTVGMMIFFFFSFQRENGMEGSVTARYVWHTQPLWLVLPVLFFVLVLFLYGMKKVKGELPNPLLYLLYISLTGLVGYCMYTPNIFGRALETDTMHGHAYFNSIYNVFWGHPYTESVTSIYGHYGIFYKLPMKLLGGNYNDFVLLTAAIGALSFLCAFLTLHVLLKKSIFKVLGSVAMTLPILSMRGGYYWQAWPHRVIFMSIFLLYGALCLKYKKLNKITLACGYLLAAVGIVWNVECGIFCAAAWAALQIITYTNTKKWKVLPLIGTVAVSAGGVIVSFLAAFAFVNLYNRFAGGASNTIGEFLFPLLTKSYMTDVLILDMPLYPCAYMLFLLLFLCCAAWGISHMTIFHKKGKDTVGVLPAYTFFLAVLSLGQMTYFMNRPAYHNLDICFLGAVIGLCIVAEQGIQNFQNVKLSDWGTKSFGEVCKISLTGMSLAVLFTLSLGNLMQYSSNSEIKSNFHQEAELSEFLNSVAQIVPKDTYGFGLSVPDVYSMLGWNTNCYTLDFSDLVLRPQMPKEIYADVEEKMPPGIFANLNTMIHMQQYEPEEHEKFLEKYALVKEFAYGGSSFQYYEKKN